MTTDMVNRTTSSRAGRYRICLHCFTVELLNVLRGIATILCIWLSVQGQKSKRLSRLCESTWRNCKHFCLQLSSGYSDMYPNRFICGLLFLGMRTGT